MNKRTVKTTMVVLMLLVVALYFVSGTYARYASEFSGEVTAQVAKWSIDGSQVNSLAFTVATNEFVVADRIAPATTATAETQIDLSGTEVAVDVAIEAADDFASKLSDLGLDATQLTLKIEKTEGTTVTVEKDGEGTKANPFVCKLQGGKALTGTLNLKITLAWVNEGAEWNAKDEKNVKDTAVGTNAESKTLELPVKVIVQQHVA